MPQLQVEPSTDPSVNARNNLIAIGLMCLAVLLFGLLDTTAKFLTATYSSYQIAWCRYAFHLLIAALMLNPVTMPEVWRTRRLKLQILRGVFIVASSIGTFLALRTLQLDQATSIFFVSPLVVAVLAGPLLGEWIGPRRMAAVIVGFAGVLLVTRPGFDGFKWAFLLSLAAATTNAIYSILTRMVTRWDSSQTSFVYSGLLGTIMLAPALPFVWIWPDNWLDWLRFAATGVFGGIGHLFLIMAHRRAPAPILAPFIYTSIVWNILFGLAVFGDVPDSWTLAGAAIVIAAGLYLLLRERPASRNA